MPTPTDCRKCGRSYYGAAGLLCDEWEREAKRPLDESTCSAFSIGCSGCQWQSDTEGQWCEMFQSAPDQLPCTQHDKFEGERLAMSAMIRKCPAIIPMMVMGLSEPNVQGDGSPDEKSQPTR